MTPTVIYKIISDAIVMANHARKADQQIPLSADTALYGTTGHLDSMALVAFLIDIEEAFLDLDIQINLSDERAMSQTRSPFRDVTTLIAYIQSLLTETPTTQEAAV